ncbi:MAG: hypothetical protein M0C28_04505 [Candidatus Moduliflexus flocculans]|nr:hypothetical protein [Candidatus Moduliflexus flocculans]
MDCPICDKAGECKLQDYYDAHGRFPGRFVEPREKRDKLVAIGRGLVLDRERCILCTRCVRFLRKITKYGRAGRFRARRPHRDRDLRGRPRRQRLCRQPRRHLPCRGHHRHGLPLQDTGLVPGKASVGLSALRPRVRRRRRVRDRISPRARRTAGLPHPGGRESCGQRALDLRSRAGRPPRHRRRPVDGRDGQGRAGRKRSLADGGRGPRGAHPGRSR